MACQCLDDPANRNCALSQSGAVSRHDIAAIWVAFFSRWLRYRCRQVNYASAAGGLVECGGYGTFSYFPPELYMLACTYM